MSCTKINLFNKIIVNYFCTVNNNIRILAATLLTVIYCFSIDTVTNTIAHYAVADHLNTSQEKIISEFSSKLFCHTTQSESSLNNLNNLPAPTFKNPSIEFGGVSIAAEQLFNSEFAQYTSCSGKILINYRKSDIIFPFHYFW